MDADDYTDGEWAASVGHSPLAGRPHEDLLLLHRHWMWANQQREVFERLVGESTENELLKMGVGVLATKQFGFMFVWYGLLWAVIEACIDPKEGRSVDLRGQFRADIDKLAPVSGSAGKRFCMSRAAERSWMRESSNSYRSQVLRL